MFKYNIIRFYFSYLKITQQIYRWEIILNFIKELIWKKMEKRAESLGHRPVPLPINEKNRINELKKINLVEKELEKDFRFSSLPKLAAYLTECPQAAINIIGENKQYCKASYGQNSALTYISKEIPRGLSTCQHVINNDFKPLVIEDLSKDNRTKATFLAAGKALPKFYAGAPIVSSNGYILGSFCVFDDKPKKIDNNKLDGLRILADQFIQLFESFNYDNVKIDKKEKNSIKTKYYSSVSIIFIDFVQFTKLSNEIEPGELIELLNNYFDGFDKVMERFNVKKIKTIGDSYMAVSGIPNQNSNHAQIACQACLEIIKFVKGMKYQLESIGKKSWDVRIGINTGPVISGFNGDNFDIWGDSVNVASRMESSGIPSKVQISESTKKFLNNCFKIKKRENVQLKDKGLQNTFIIS